MSLQPITKILYGDAPGKRTELTYFKLGPLAATPKIYLQAALHADEQPGILILHHLLSLLEQADEAGLLKAQFVIFPMVNPLGMADIAFLQHQGRYDRASGINFNRRWPDLFQAIASTIADQLTADAHLNIQRVRAAVAQWLAEQTPVTAIQQQQHYVMQEVYDADYVFDLHCDNDALAHIFTTPQSTAIMQVLSDWMGAAATLTAEDSGGGSFDEVWPSLWFRLARAFPDKPIPQACHAATLEYRGQLDTFDALNAEDARRLYAFFQSQDWIGGELLWPQPSPTPAATALAATEMTRVQQAGLLAYQVELGQWVEKGDVLADLVALSGEGAFQQRTPIRAGTSGMVISRNVHKYVWPGCSIAKVVGNELLPERGVYLLQDK